MRAGSSVLVDFSLRFRSFAPPIEKRCQLLGVDMCQGYLWSEAVSLTSFGPKLWTVSAANCPQLCSLSCHTTVKSVETTYNVLT